jgi:L-fucono-1,5-lactonase
MRRRDVLKLALSAGAVWITNPMEAAMPPVGPVIDAHIHLFDTARPQGVPWPEKTDSVLYKPALPERYAKIAKPFGVVGAIAIEASPWLSDNDWLLRTAETSPLIVGIIGDLDPSSHDFSKHLDRLHQNELFRGIRYGNLWNYNLGAQLHNSLFLENLKLLAQLGLVLETANPNPMLIDQVVKLTDRLPELRIIVDHLPQATPPEETGARRSYEHDLQHLSERPNIFVKGSEVLRRINGQVPRDLKVYQPWLDEIWGWFGEDRLLFGSDWPNGDTMAPFADTLAIVREYVVQKGPAAAEKFFWKNSTIVYRWRPRDPAQSHLLA